MTRPPFGCDEPFDPDENFSDVNELLCCLLASPECENADCELRRLGYLIDVADDCQSGVALTTAVDACERLLTRSGLSDEQKATTHYFLSNAYDGIRRAQRLGWDLYAWEQPEWEKQMVHLRTARLLGRRCKLERQRLCQICTNLGNLLSHCGRLTEAIAAWDEALELDSAFTMAVGNRGSGLWRYTLLAHDDGHRLYLAREAYRSLSAALEIGAEGQHPLAIKVFEALKREIESRVDVDVLLRQTETRDFAESWSKEERAYRIWCLDHRLFLNDLNDINVGAVAAADVITLPSLTTEFSAPQPSVIGLFNQLKQEYVAARYFCFEGVHGAEAHFADRDLTLVNTMDSPAYGLNVERVRVAFRTTYSLFDKIGFFVNEYLNLGIPASRVSFRNVWYMNGQRDKGIRPELGDPKSSGLRGLFWLTKDLYEPNSEFADAIEPEARLLATIRNQLEHKYLKLHTSLSDLVPPHSNLGFEALAYSITLRDFEAKTIKVMQLARAALIYLVQAVYTEETKRSQSSGEKILVPVLLPTFDNHQTQ